MAFEKIHEQRKKIEVLEDNARRDRLRAVTMEEENSAMKTKLAMADEQNEKVKIEMESLIKTKDFWQQKFKELEARLEDEKRAAKSGQEALGQPARMESRVCGLEHMVKCMYDAYIAAQPDQQARKDLGEKMDSTANQYGNFK
jgi:hypothetical protein